MTPPHAWGDDHPILCVTNKLYQKFRKGLLADYPKKKFQHFLMTNFEFWTRFRKLFFVCARNSWRILNFFLSRWRRFGAGFLNYSVAFRGQWTLLSFSFQNSSYVNISENYTVMRVKIKMPDRIPFSLAGDLNWHFWTPLKVRSQILETWPILGSIPTEKIPPPPSRKKLL